MQKQRFLWCLQDRGYQGKDIWVLLSTYQNCHSNMPAGNEWSAYQHFMICHIWPVLPDGCSITCPIHATSRLWWRQSLSRYCSQWKLLVAHISNEIFHGDVIKWKHFPRYWPFLRWIHRSSVDPPAPPPPQHTQWPVTRGFYVFFDLRLNKRLNKQSRHHRNHYNVTVMRYLRPRCWHQLHIIVLKQNTSTTWTFNLH